MTKRNASLRAAKHHSLVRDIRSMIEHAREHVARSVNTGVTSLYWHVGRRIKQEVLKGKRADYGERIVVTVSRQLVRDYGQGFSERVPLKTRFVIARRPLGRRGDLDFLVCYDEIASSFHSSQ